MYLLYVEDIEDEYETVECLSCPIMPALGAMQTGIVSLPIPLANIFNLYWRMHMKSKDEQRMRICVPLARPK